MSEEYIRPVESHPGIPLVQHLRAVGIDCRRYMLRLPEASFELPVQLLADVAYICGCLHDIGKATIYFQHYLKHPAHEQIGPKEHALISALLVREAIKEYLSTKELEADTKALLVQAAYITVKRHHGNLSSFENEHNLSVGDLDKVKVQIKAFIEPEAAEIITDLLKSLHLNSEDWQDWKGAVSMLQVEELPNAYYDEIADERWWNAGQQALLHDYYLTEYLFACLLLADKSDVKGTAAVAPGQVSFALLDAYRTRNGHKEPKGELNVKRHQVFEETLFALERTASQEQRLYSLTLPTGMGKTLLSLGVAIRLRDRVLGEKGCLVFGIPFTSIIDQNYQVFTEVLGNPDSTCLLKHHHLASLEYKTAEDTVFDTAKSRHLIETWQSAVIVTTFVQLFESVITNQKGKLLKLPNLSNSIIVLDEVQQIPYERWPLMRLVLIAIARHYNCYFLFTSATQPLLFEPGKEVSELVPEYEQYYKLFNRTKLVNRCQQPIAAEGFEEQVLNYLGENPQADVLLILNTIKNAKSAFSNLATALVEEDRLCLYLSTHITPYERKHLIGLIKQKKSTRKPLLIVSTQLVEAGVDISVDAVFRELAPLDSIIQAAGRANRNNQLPQPAPVFIYQIEETKKTAARIYGGELLVKTQRLFKDKELVEEKDYLPLIKHYYLQVKLQSEGVTDPKINEILKLNFEEAGKFRLIEETISEPIYICLNKEARELWEQHKAILSDDELSSWQKKDALSKIKGRFYDYVINIRVPFGQKTIMIDREAEWGFYFVEDPEEDSAYNYHAEDYSCCTGFQESTIGIF